MLMGRTNEIHSVALQARLHRVLQGGETWNGDGDGWQEYCNQLLALHHPDAYQVIPDGDRGDCGLEGHSTDGRGCAYQCYAPDAEINIAQRRDKHKIKISNTVATLIRQRDRLGRVVGSHTIQRLIFLFPRLDSADVNAHAQQQTAVLRTAVAECSIACIAPDVVLAVWAIPPYLVAERTELERIGARRVPLPQVDIGDAEIEAHRIKAAEALVGASEKLARRFGAPRTPELMDVLLNDALVGSEQERLLAARPEVYEQYVRLKARQQRDVTLRSLEGGTAELSLADLKDNLRLRIEDEIPSVHARDADTLASGSVAGWLIECPLDFPQEDSE
jgi:hypothetical protein